MGFRFRIADDWRVVSRRPGGSAAEGGRGIVGASLRHGGGTGAAMGHPLNSTTGNLFARIMQHFPFSSRDQPLHCCCRDWADPLERLAKRHLYANFGWFVLVSAAHRLDGRLTADADGRWNFAICPRHGRGQPSSQAAESQISARCRVPLTTMTIYI